MIQLVLLIAKSFNIYSVQYYIDDIVVQITLKILANIIYNYFLIHYWEVTWNPILFWILVQSN